MINNRDELSITRFQHKIRAKDLEKKCEKNEEMSLNDSEVTISNTTIIGTNNKINGKNNTVIGDLNNIRGNFNIVRGNRNVCNGHNYKVYGQHNTICGNKNKVEGDKNKVSGINNVVSGKNNMNYNKKKNNKKRKLSTTTQIPDEEDVLDKDILEELLCIICMERKINTVILDCGHSKMCVTCSRVIIFGEETNRKCPVCRKELKKGIIKIF